VQAEAENGIHEIVFAGDGVEVPQDITELLPRRDLAVSEVGQLFIGIVAV
jgi:hypothetical protein